MRDIYNYSLKESNTFGVDARCRRYVEFTSVSELRAILPLLRPTPPVLVIGAGSNILFSGDYPGTVIHSGISGVTVSGDGLIRVGSGERWDSFVVWAISHGYYGLENLSLIPGDVGAAAVQNIGAYGSECKDFIYDVEAVEIATGRLCLFSNAECRYAYRQSRFKGEWKGRFVVTYVNFALSTRFIPNIDYGDLRRQLRRETPESEKTLSAGDVRQAVIDIRRSKLPDPAEEGNAGSFFTNPIVPREQYEALSRRYPAMPHYDMPGGEVKIPAAWLIEQCGWKGRALGTAAVHSKQALVIVNRGGATGQDILLLAETIRRDVEKMFGISIQPEVIIV